MSRTEAAATDGSIRFWDRIAERYARQPIADEDTYRRKLALTQAYLMPETNVLEFGCGTGSTALLHASKVRSIVAIDSSPGMIEIANRKLAQSNIDNVEFRCGTLFDPCLQDASFGAVLGLNVLHLLRNRRACIRKVWDLLAPGGVFVTSTPCLSGRWQLLRPLLALGAALRVVPRVWFFDQPQLEKEIANAGFALIDGLPAAKPHRAVFLIARKQ